MIDHKSLFRKIADNTKAAVMEQFPIEGKLNVLEMTNVDIPDLDYNIDDEYEARYSSGTLNTPVYADMILRTKDGQIINEKKRHKIMDLPTLTDRGTFLVNGNEYTVAIQNRVRPGIYPIMKQTGEIQGTINAAKGLPQKADIAIDPKSGLFKFIMGQSEMKLYPIAKAIGIDDETLEKSWGLDVFTQNRTGISQRVYDSTIKNAAKRMTGKDYDNIKEASQALKEKFAGIVLDKAINARTIGVDSETLDSRAILATTQKLLNINHGNEKPVDRNSMEFKDFLWVDDFIKERIALHARSVKPKILRKVDKVGEIDKVITSSFLTKPVRTFFSDSSLSELGDQYNPLDMMSTKSKVTSTGEGGIQNLQVVEPEMRALAQSSMGILDPIHTPESEKIGIDLHLAAGARKDGKKLKMNVYNVRTKQIEEIDHEQAARATIALPGKSIKNGQFTTKEIRASQGGEFKVVPTDQVDYIIPRQQTLFDSAVNMIPFLNNNSGARMFMAAKQMGQSIPVVGREEPLVQVGINDKSFEDRYGRDNAVFAQSDGVVEKVEGNKIFISKPDGTVDVTTVRKDFPLNHDHLYDTDILVKPGDKVKAGQLIGDSNFTKNGKLALGQNMRVAYIADGGYNFEDGITVSESAANRLASMHLYRKQFRAGKDVYQFPDKFRAQFPNVITKDRAEKLDERGVVKEGSVVKPGDPLVVAMRKADLDDENLTISQINKKLQRPWRDASEYWDGDGEGIVTKVVRDEEGNAKVYVKSIETGTIADKIAGRYGNKGVISRILPDDKMPRDKEGNPFEILMSPLTIPSRMNPGQMYETAISKVAKKTGKPIIWENFKSDNTLTDVKRMLKENGFDEDGAEEIFDADGNKLGRGLTGYQYILKLAKQAKTGFSARGAGAEESYDSDKIPTKGGEEGAKALDQLSLYGMLAHGATANLREMATDKASANHEFWNAVRNGAPLPPPKQTFAYQKFMNYLKGAGVNVERRGDYLQMLPFTDDDISKNSGGEVTRAKFINAKDLKAKRGGFMDPKIFGTDGDRWGHIKLNTPVINPTFKNGLREILGITESEMKNMSVKNIQEQLRTMDLGKLEEELRDKLSRTTSEQTENQLSKRLRYVKALRTSGIKPEKAYIMNRVPVLPSNMRPIVGGEDDSQVVSEVNFLYRDLMLSNEALRTLDNIKHVPPSFRKELEDEIQAGAEAIAGLSSPVGKYAAEREPKGFIEQIKGVKAKEGYFQRKVLKKKLDVTGRGVITPDPELGIDELGLPEDMAWKVYSPFVEARLRRATGMSHAEVLEAMKKRDRVALGALEAEMKNRPVVINRPPSLHKFSMLGFNPKLVNGKTIKIPSLVVKGFNADFDGDALIVHVPTRPEAVAEVKEKMMAKSNLFNPREGSLMHVAPGEATLGIFKASQTDEGLKRIKDIVPAEYQNLVTPNMKKKEIEGLFAEIARTNPDQYVDLSKKLSRFGNEYAFRTASSVTLNDLEVKDPEIDRIRREALDSFIKYRGDKNKINQVLASYSEQVREILKTKKNNFVDMVQSGAKSNMGQVNQMIGIPMQYTDHAKNPIPMPVLSDFAHGMGGNDYWVSQFSSRRGMIDRKMETTDPGAFAKMLLINTIGSTTGDQTPLDDDGEEFPVTSKDAMNRFLAADVLDKDGKKVAEKGDPLTPKKAAMLQKYGVENVRVHTVLSSRSSKIINPKSYGLTYEGKLLDPDTNIGAIAGQAIAEPLQQGAMKSFHTGGVVGAEADKYKGKFLGGFEKVKKILEMPGHVPGQATLSDVNDKVVSIIENPAGGQIVKTESGKEMFIEPGLRPVVKVGDTLEKGQKVSEGFVHPRDVLNTRGMEAARKFMVEELVNSYRESGTNVDRRNIEVIVKSIANNAKVVDPGESDFIKGDIVDYDEIKMYNSQKPWQVPTGDDEIMGKRLAEDVGDFEKGTLIDKSNVSLIRRLGGSQVLVKNDPIKIKPILLGIKDKPVKASDWLTQLAYGYIERGIEQRAPAMEKAPIHGTSPIPAYVHGIEFGLRRPY